MCSHYFQFEHLPVDMTSSISQHKLSPTVQISRSESNNLRYGQNTNIVFEMEIVSTKTRNPLVKQRTEYLFSDHLEFVIHLHHLHCTIRIVIDSIRNSQSQFLDKYKN